MVSTRSSNQNTRPQNVKLTRADYDCARTLMRLRISSSPVWGGDRQSSARSTAYNLRPSPPSRQWHDEKADPTWVPWTRGDTRWAQNRV